MTEHRHTAAASRRGVLSGLSALAAASLLPHAAAAQGAARAAKPAAKPFRIDVHHHLAACGSSDAAASADRPLSTPRRDDAEVWRCSVMVPSPSDCWPAP